MPRRRLAELNCEIVEEGESPRLAVVLCHGFGAPGDDLVPIAGELQRIDTGIHKSVRFYFPAAPIDLTPAGMPGGRAWWPINMEELVRISESGRWEDVRRAMPAGLTSAREQILALFAAIQTETKLPTSRIVLGGFSQGAMLACDTALQLPETPAGLIVASGTLLSEQDWGQSARRMTGLRVIQGHGQQDPLLPFAGAVALRDLLIEAGHQVEFLPFNGGHTIDSSLLAAVSGFLAEFAATPK